MERVTSHDWKLFMLAGVLVSLLAWPGTSEAQTVTGQASAVQATVFGALGLRTTTALSKTATLSGTRDAREASDRKSTRLNSSHDQISYAVFCLKKKKREHSL